MTEIVVGTANEAKARQVEQALAGTGIATMRVTDLLAAAPSVPEEGAEPADNAAGKAVFYARLVGRPAIALDYALAFDGLTPEEQPGVHVRRLRGYAGRPTDDELLRHYSDLFRRHGDSLRGRWRTGVAAATPEGRVRQTTAEVERLFVARPCPARVPGHPLASLQLVRGRYVAELEPEEEEQLVRETLREPLLRVLEGVAAVRYLTPRRIR